jgi:hypothetical protein
MSLYGEGVGRADLPDLLADHLSHLAISRTFSAGSSLTLYPLLDRGGASAGTGAGSPRIAFDDCGSYFQCGSRY